MELTAEQTELRDAVRLFARRELTEDVSRRIDETGAFPAALYRALADLGWLGIPFPSVYGGADGDLLTMLLVIEELSHASFAAGNAYFRNVVNGGLNVLAAGTDEQKHMILPELIRGNLKMCYAMTEPDAGSDVGNIRTRAQRVGDHYEVTGTKVFITGAAESDWIQLFARTGERRHDITTLLVDSRSPGISYAEIPKLGNLAMKTYEVRLDRVSVPRMNVLGQVNGAWRHVRQSLDLERVAVAAECVGAARACVDLALSYARARVQFGRPIVDFQAIQHKIVDMTMDLETSRLITFHSARLLQDGGSGTFHAALAKYHSGQMYFRCAIDGMSILGGYGYTTAFAMERHLRDAALYRVVPGQEVLKNTMARMILRDGIHR